MINWPLIRDVFFCIFGWTVIILLVAGYFFGYGYSGVDFAGNVW